MTSKVIEGGARAAQKVETASNKYYRSSSTTIYHIKEKQQ